MVVRGTVKAGSQADVGQRVEQPAEGPGRDEFSHFLFHASGSLLELQTQLLIAEELEYLPREEVKRLLAKCEDVGRALAGLINSIGAKVA